MPRYYIPLKRRKWFMHLNPAKKLWKPKFLFVNKDAGMNTSSCRVKTTLGQQCLGVKVV